MIYLNQELYQRVCEVIKDAHDCRDILSDLKEIDNALYGLQYGEGQKEAWLLDYQLRNKYPLIKAFLDEARSMLLFTAGRTQSIESVEVMALKQDRCGIICHAALKKGIVQNIKEMLDVRIGR